MARFSSSNVSWPSNEPGFSGVTEFSVEGGTLAGDQPQFGGVYPFTANYVRIGNLVHFNIFVDFTNIQSFGTGQYYLSLPFSASVSYMFREGCLHDADVDRVYHISGEVEAGGNYMKLYTSDVQFADRVYDFPFTATEPVTLTTADSFHISGSYICAD